MIEAKKNGTNEFEIWGSGKPVREWCYIDDLIKILNKSISLKSTNETVNIAQNKGYSIYELAKITKKILKYDGELKTNLESEDGAPIKVLDNKKFKEIFGEFSFTNIYEGIEKTIRFYEMLLL